MVAIRKPGRPRKPLAGWVCYTGLSRKRYRARAGSMVNGRRLMIHLGYFEHWEQANSVLQEWRKAQSAIGSGVVL